MGYCNVNNKKMNPHGGQVKEGLDFSVNINPLPMNKEVKKAIIDEIDHLHFYPEIDGREVIEALAKYYQYPSSQMILGNGATELIYLYGRTLKPRQVLIISPTFNEYERAFRLAGANVKHYVLKAEDGFSFKLNDFLQQLEFFQPDLVVLCQPNNPTGQLFSSESIQSIAHTLKAWGGHLFIDESFIEFTSEPSYRSIANDHIFCVQSLTKYYSIPYLRLGIGFGGSKLIHKLYGQKEPWSINGFALKAITPLIKDEERRKRTSLWLEKEKSALIEALKGIKGVRVFPTITNFILIYVEDVDRFMKGLQKGKESITLRTCEDFVGLNKHFLRIAVKGEKENQYLIQQLMEMREN